MQNFRGSSGLQLINDGFELFSIGGDPDPRPTNPDRTFRNRLTIVNFTAELDRVTVYCGTGSNREQANFCLRIYSKLHILSQTMYSFNFSKIEGASVKYGNGNRNGNWKRNWKLKMVVKCSCYNREYLWQRQYMYRTLRSSLVLGPSQLFNVHEKLGGPEDEASMQLTSN